ncbi:MAG: hypothetical protein ACOCSK_02000 [Rhodothermales bacterium]
MKQILAFVLLATLIAVDAAGQSSTVLLGSDRPPGRISFGSTFQRVVDLEQSISETSIPLQVFLPLGRSLGLRFLASGARAGGRDLTPITGLTDAYVSADYALKFGSSSIIVGVGANLPSGTSLTDEEFETSILLGRSPYNFNLPSFGEGFNVSPSVTVAFPIGNGLVVGAGLAYQMRGGFVLADGFDDEYVPGDEIIATGGLDVRLGPAAVASADVSLALYGTDKIGETEVYQSGRTLAFSSQLRLYPGFDEMRLYVRYRVRQGGSLVLQGVLVPAAQQAVPDQLDVRWHYKSQVRDRVSLGVLVQARHFTRSEFSRPLTVVDGGLEPTLSLIENVALSARLVYSIGSFRGVDVGSGLIITL